MKPRRRNAPQAGAARDDGFKSELPAVENGMNDLHQAETHFKVKPELVLFCENQNQKVQRLVNLRHES